MSTAPDTQTTTGTSSRQRRVAQPSARIESARRLQRRQRALWGGGVALVVVLVAGAAALVLSRAATSAQGHQVPIEGSRQHVDQGTDMSYRNRPPSGDHYPTPAGYGVFTREIPTGNLVHSLERGGVVVYYRPDLCDPACVGQLQQAYNDAPKSREWGVVKMVVVPWQEDMDHAVAAAAWGWIDEMDQPDPQRIVGPGRWPL